MDLDAMLGYSPPPQEEPEDKKRRRKPPIKGVSIKFTAKEKEFVRQNHESMTDKQIGRELGRSRKSVERVRTRMGLTKPHGAPPGGTRSPSKSRKAFIASLDDSEKEEFFMKELRCSALYKSFANAYRSEPHYVRLYEQKYVEFMMDPTIETVTSMERDIWHEMTLAQVREMEYLRKEKEDKKFNEDGIEISLSYAKEIAQCQEAIRKCQESLNVERRQRLRNSTDSAITFTQVIKDLRSPQARRVAGEMAAMLKYIAERHYNDHLGNNIISGAAQRYDVDLLFKGGKEPEGLNGDFTGQAAVEVAQEGQEAGQESPLSAD